MKRMSRVVSNGKLTNNPSRNRPRGHLDCELQKIDDRSIISSAMASSFSSGGTISHLGQDNYDLEKVHFMTIARDENFSRQTFLKLALFTNSALPSVFQGSSERLFAYSYARLVSCYGRCSANYSAVQERNSSTSL